jgi:protein-S-isoprenylcysteine O-methyltransferase Ste14
MDSETVYRLAFLALLMALAAMRAYFMVKVRRSGGRITPDEQAVKREGGGGVLITRVVLFFALIAFLVGISSERTGRGAFLARLAALDWLHWDYLRGFWWTQIHLDTQWSAQLQLKENHHLVTSGPYAYIRHPLYVSMFGWCIALPLLTANWIFLVICALTCAALLWRVPKEEQMMLEAFGDEYKAYMEHTGRFAPKFQRGWCLKKFYHWRGA